MGRSLDTLAVGREAPTVIRALQTLTVERSERQLRTAMRTRIGHRDDVAVGCRE
jgi:hypothetical protein